MKVEYEDMIESLQKISAVSQSSPTVGKSLRVIYERMKQMPKIPPDTQRKCSTCKYCIVHTYIDGQWGMPHVDKVKCYLTAKDIQPNGICEKYEFNDTRV